MKRHWNYEYASLLNGRLKIENNFRKHASEDPSSRLDALVLQKMDEFTEAAFITTVSGSASEWRSHAAAGNAAKIARAIREHKRLRNRFAAYRAGLLIDRAHALKAILAHGQAGDADERGVADTTISREKGCEEAFGGPFSPKGNRTSWNLGDGLLDASSVPATAEDDLLPNDRSWLLPNGLPQYSQRSRVTQREFPPREELAFVTRVLSAGPRVLWPAG